MRGRDFYLTGPVLKQDASHDNVWIGGPGSDRRVGGSGHDRAFVIGPLMAVIAVIMVLVVRARRSY